VTVREWLCKYASIFQQASIEEAADEASALLCHALKLGKAEIFAQPERALNVEELAMLDGLTVRRLRREPAAYITGCREFYGLNLFVDPRVLIPRPETEVLVEAAIVFARSWVMHNHRRMLAVDVGTGCGAIAIALATHVSEAQLYAVDISPAALEVTADNIHRHGLKQRIMPVRGDLLEPISGRTDLIVANLPYIPRGDLPGLQPEIYMYEPLDALDGGENGIDLIRALLEQSPDKLAAGGALFLEIGEGQEQRLMPVVTRLLRNAEIRLIKDLAGINRCMKIIMPC